ncbi:MAG: helicase-associated domain-containing protein [Gemmataceae bacterium]
MAWYNPTSTQRPFHDHRWVRADMAGWDAKWAGLRPESRKAFLSVVASRHGDKPPVITEAEARPLSIGGFLTPRKDRTLVTNDQVRGFAQRLLTLVRADLLGPGCDLRGYVQMAYYQYELEMALSRVLEKATGMTFYAVSGSPLDLIISGPRWADWVADFLNDPLAKPVLEAVTAAGGVVPLASAGTLLPGHRPEAVRKTIDALVNHLALVEGLDDADAGLRVGFLRSAWAARQGQQVRAAKALEPVTPKETTPADGTVIPDIAAALLELAGGPVRVKQNGELYVRDLERLTPVLPPLPRWYPAPPPDDRVYTALSYCRDLEFIRLKRTKEGDTLEQTPAGRDWLALPHESKFAAVYRDVGTVIEAQRYEGPSDEVFLGYDVAVVPRKGKEKPPTSPSGLTKRYDPLLLRAALRRALGRLEVGTFYRINDVVEHVLAADNPLLLGSASASEVHIARQGRMVLPLDEIVEGVGRELLRFFLGTMLGPLGAMQIGWDGNPELMIARQPRMDQYFDPSAPVAAPADAQPTRVLVQPDFTVIIFGLDAAPAADLSAFAERDRSSLTPGSFTFRLTREAVLRAAAAGLTGEQIVARLKKHASTPVPANVETQIRTWAGQIHRATAEPLLVIRCGTSEGAEKAMTALGNKAVRLGPTNVGWSAQKLTAALRQKLASQGVIIG